MYAFTSQIVGCKENIAKKNIFLNLSINGIISTDNPLSVIIFFAFYRQKEITFVIVCEYLGTDVQH